MRYSYDILEALTDSDAPDVVKLGAVSLASEIVDAHIQDPIIRKAWAVLRDVIIESWIEKIGNKEVEKEDVEKEEVDSRKKSESAIEIDSYHKSISLSIFNDVIKIGRLPTSHIRFDHASVARMHAVIDKDKSESRWKITDLGSASGTKVNGNEVENAIVGPGDILSFGICTLKLME